MEQMCKPRLAGLGFWRLKNACLEQRMERYNLFMCKVCQLKKSVVWFNTFASLWLSDKSLSRVNCAHAGNIVT